MAVPSTAESSMNDDLYHIDWFWSPTQEEGFSPNKQDFSPGNQCCSATSNGKLRSPHVAHPDATTFSSSNDDDNVHSGGAPQPGSSSSQKTQPWPGVLTPERRFRAVSSSPSTKATLSPLLPGQDELMEVVDPFDVEMEDLSEIQGDVAEMQECIVTNMNVQPEQSEPPRRCESYLYESSETKNTKETGSADPSSSFRTPPAKRKCIDEEPPKIPKARRSHSLTRRVPPIPRSLQAEFDAVAEM